MSWNRETQQAVKDCDHPGNCPCRPEECEVCKGTGEVTLIKHRPLVWARPAGLGQDAHPVAMSWAEASNVLRATILGFIIGSEEGEEMTCPECRGEGSLS